MGNTQHCLGTFVLVLYKLLLYWFLSSCPSVISSGKNKQSSDLKTPLDIIVLRINFCGSDKDYTNIGGKFQNCSGRNSHVQISQNIPSFPMLEAEAQSVSEYL